MEMWKWSSLDTDLKILEFENLKMKQPNTNLRIWKFENLKILR